MHPSHGTYRCKKCLRIYPTGWDGPITPQAIRPNGRIFQQGEQMEKKTQEVRLYERRHAKRAEKSQMFRYPFGLLTVLDFFAKVKPAKKANRKEVAA